MKYACKILLFTISLSFGSDLIRITDPPQAPIRPVAEFERSIGVLISFPLGIPLPFVQMMSEDVIIYCLVPGYLETSAQNQLSDAGVDMDNVEFIIGDVDTYWTQDYGPFFVVDGNNDMVIVDFEYNRPRPYDNQAPFRLSLELDIDYYDSDVVHNGGNLMFDGYNTIASSTIVYTENGSIDVDQRMLDYYGAVNHMTTSDPTTNYHQHINCWAKFLSPEKIMVISVPEYHSFYNNIEETVEFYENQMNCFGEPYKVYRVYTPNTEPYVNSFILNDKVYVPVGLGQWDDEAIIAFEDALPGYDVVGVEGTWLDPWLPTDALHCRVLAIPDIQMLQIFHNPIDDQEFPLDGYDLSATIVDLSETGVIEESVTLHWTNDLMDDYESLTMTLSEIDDNYISAIPVQPIDTQVRYFLTASDNSGRDERLPIAGYYTFTAFGGNPADPGDVNLDDSLDILDIVLIVNHIINASQLSGYPLYLADINDDGILNILDVILLINIVLE
ncbi:MAG: hypothetical protein HN729_12220 [Candidatus Marinimicrobia bacterium]|jgi:agmatine/peptidylarginine deiminase|nr:hypothetical protein [Candidatus Neomarinimicrobiota bacterium]MBT3634260.1 hypothetical protein [Candidatus Neomarinimicrobiota bacterium]MBT3682941.1 hypothetical protein [Candidatus Neomarinimicrobiota bacterium]MBT3760069.1 hypothetical protein [Candidatus Neomarinimicrobiota bacterium]MBT3896164.1 hypothetical protein [Candidatus Neomarinimicrobiota bacterium]